MSVNRENVTWQSEDGTWNIGFFDFFDTGDPDDEDYDYEWDVDYDFDHFNWVATRQVSADAAFQRWPGANPGGTMIVPYDAENAELCKRYDEMAQAYRKEQR